MSNGDDAVTRIMAQPNLSQEHVSIDVREISTLAAANPLLAAANPILIMLRSLRVASAPGDIATLRGQLLVLVGDFSAACARARIPELECELASYTLCATVDECIQTTPWGATANWAQDSLLVRIHRDNRGGDRFFDILDRAERAPTKHRLLLELLYVCLALGFMGRYHRSGPAGRQELAERRERTYLLIRKARGEADLTLSGNLRALAVERRLFGGFGVTALTASLLAVICFGFYATYALWLSAQFEELHVGRLELAPPREQPVQVARPAAKPRLAQLLGRDKRLEVMDFETRSVVTMPGEGMFDSGSATPLSSVEPLLDEVARALTQVEGNIQVNGYTDDVPTRTVRFRNNKVLSKARADAVRARLGLQPSLLPRMTSEGYGEADPVTTKPEERARNRRVEIVLEVPNGAR